jgi:hypothetical protein
VSLDTSDARLPRDRRRIRHTTAGRVDAGHADVAIVDGRARRRLIPDVDARRALDADRGLDARIADGDVASDSRVGCRSGNQNPVRVADGRVLFNGVVVAVENADAEVVVGS